MPFVKFYHRQHPTNHCHMLHQSMDGLAAVDVVLTTYPVLLVVRVVVVPIL